MIQKLITYFMANIKQLWIDPAVFRLSGIALINNSDVASMEGSVRGVPMDGDCSFDSPTRQVEGSERRADVMSLSPGVFLMQAPYWASNGAK